MGQSHFELLDPLGRHHWGHFLQGLEDGLGGMEVLDVSLEKPVAAAAPHRAKQLVLLFVVSSWKYIVVGGTHRRLIIVRIISCRGAVARA